MDASPVRGTGKPCQTPPTSVRKALVGGTPRPLQQLDPNHPNRTPSLVPSPHGKRERLPSSVGIEVSQPRQPVAPPVVWSDKAVTSADVVSVEAAVPSLTAVVRAKEEDAAREAVEPQQQQQQRQHPPTPATTTTTTVTASNPAPGAVPASARALLCVLSSVLRNVATKHLSAGLRRWAVFRDAAESLNERQCLKDRQDWVDTRGHQALNIAVKEVAAQAEDDRCRDADRVAAKLRQSCLSVSVTMLSMCHRQLLSHAVAGWYRWTAYTEHRIQTDCQLRSLRQSLKAAEDRVLYAREARVKGKGGAADGGLAGGGGGTPSERAAARETSEREEREMRLKVDSLSADKVRLTRELKGSKARLVEAIRESVSSRETALFVQEELTHSQQAVRESELCVLRLQKDVDAERGLREEGAIKYGQLLASEAALRQRLASLEQDASSSDKSGDEGEEKRQRQRRLKSYSSIVFVRASSWRHCAVTTAFAHLTAAAAASRSSQAAAKWARRANVRRCAVTVCHGVSAIHAVVKASCFTHLADIGVQDTAIADAEKAKDAAVSSEMEARQAAECALAAAVDARKELALGLSKSRDQIIALRTQLSSLRVERTGQEHETGEARQARHEKAAAYAELAAVRKDSKRRLVQAVEDVKGVKVRCEELTASLLVSEGEAAQAKGELRETKVALGRETALAHMLRRSQSECADAGRAASEGMIQYHLSHLCLSFTACRARGWMLAMAWTALSCAATVASSAAEHEALADSACGYEEQLRATVAALRRRERDIEKGKQDREEVARAQLAKDASSSARTAALTLADALRCSCAVNSALAFTLLRHAGVRSVFTEEIVRMKKHEIALNEGVAAGDKARAADRARAAETSAAAEARRALAAEKDRRATSFRVRDLQDDILKANKEVGVMKKEKGAAVRREKETRAQLAALRDEVGGARHETDCAWSEVLKLRAKSDQAKKDSAAVAVVGAAGARRAAAVVVWLATHAASRSRTSCLSCALSILRRHQLWCRDSGSLHSLAASSGRASDLTKQINSLRPELGQARKRAAFCALSSLLSGAASSLRLSKLAALWVWRGRLYSEQRKTIFEFSEKLEGTLARARLAEERLGEREAEASLVEAFRCAGTVLCAFSRCVSRALSFFFSEWSSAVCWLEREEGVEMLQEEWRMALQAQDEAVAAVESAGEERSQRASYLLRVSLGICNVQKTSNTLSVHRCYLRIALRAWRARADRTNMVLLRAQADGAAAESRRAQSLHASLVAEVRANSETENSERQSLLRTQALASFRRACRRWQAVDVAAGWRHWVTVAGQARSLHAVEAIKLRLSASSVDVQELNTVKCELKKARAALHSARDEAAAASRERDEASRALRDARKAIKGHGALLRGEHEATLGLRDTVGTLEDRLKRERESAGEARARAGEALREQEEGAQAERAQADARASSLTADVEGLKISILDSERCVAVHTVVCTVSAAHRAVKASVVHAWSHWLDASRLADAREELAGAQASALHHQRRADTDCIQLRRSLADEVKRQEADLALRAALLAIMAASALTVKASQAAVLRHLLGLSLQCAASSCLAGLRSKGAVREKRHAVWTLAHAARTLYRCRLLAQGLCKMCEGALRSAAKVRLAAGVRKVRRLEDEVSHLEDARRQCREAKEAAAEGTKRVNDLKRQLKEQAAHGRAGWEEAKQARREAAASAALAASSVSDLKLVTRQGDVKAEALDSTKRQQLALEAALRDANASLAASESALAECEGRVSSRDIRLSETVKIREEAWALREAATERDALKEHLKEMTAVAQQSRQHAARLHGLEERLQTACDEVGCVFKASENSEATLSVLKDKIAHSRQAFPLTVLHVMMHRASQGVADLSRRVLMRWLCLCAESCQRRSVTSSRCTKASARLVVNMLRVAAVRVASSCGLGHWRAVAVHARLSAAISAERRKVRLMSESAKSERLSGFKSGGGTLAAGDRHGGQYGTERAKIEGERDAAAEDAKTAKRQLRTVKEQLRGLQGEVLGLRGSQAAVKESDLLKLSDAQGQCVRLGLELDGERDRADTNGAALDAARAELEDVRGAGLGESRRLQALAECERERAQATVRIHTLISNAANRPAGDGGSGSLGFAGALRGALARLSAHASAVSVSERYESALSVVRDEAVIEASERLGAISATIIGWAAGRRWHALASTGLRALRDCLTRSVVERVTCLAESQCDDLTVQISNFQTIEKGRARNWAVRRAAARLQLSASLAQMSFWRRWRASLGRSERASHADQVFSLRSQLSVNESSTASLRDEKDEALRQARDLRRRVVEQRKQLEDVKSDRAKAAAESVGKEDKECRGSRAKATRHSDAKACSTQTTSGECGLRGVDHLGTITARLCHSLSLFQHHHRYSAFQTLRYYTARAGEADAMEQAAEWRRRAEAAAEEGRALREQYAVASKATEEECGVAVTNLEQNLSESEGRCEALVRGAALRCCAAHLASSFRLLSASLRLCLSLWRSWSVGFTLSFEVRTLTRLVDAQQGHVRDAQADRDEVRAGADGALSRAESDLKKSRATVKSTAAEGLSWKSKAEKAEDTLQGTLHTMSEADKAARAKLDLLRRQLDQAVKGSKDGVAAVAAEAERVLTSARLDGVRRTLSIIISSSLRAWGHVIRMATAAWSSWADAARLEASLCGAVGESARLSTALTEQEESAEGERGQHRRTTMALLCSQIGQSHARGWDEAVRGALHRLRVSSLCAEGLILKTESMNSSVQAKSLLRTLKDCQAKLQGLEKEKGEEQEAGAASGNGVSFGAGGRATIHRQLRLCAAVCGVRWHCATSHCFFSLLKLAIKASHRADVEACGHARDAAASHALRCAKTVSRQTEEELSGRLRDCMREADGLQCERDQGAMEIKDLRKELAHSRRDVSGMRQSSSELKSTLGQVGRAGEERDNALMQLKDEKKKHRAAHADGVKLRSRIDGLVGELDAAHASLDLTEQSRKTVSEKFQRVNEEFAIVGSELQNSEANVLFLQDELSETNACLAQKAEAFRRSESMRLLVSCSVSHWHARALHACLSHLRDVGSFKAKQRAQLCVGLRHMDHSLRAAAASGLHAWHAKVRNLKTVGLQESVRMLQSELARMAQGVDDTSAVLVEF